MKKKKLLLVLTVVVLVSLLFVGCKSTNTAPVFTSTPGLTATVGIQYSYTPAATDAEGDTVTFSVAGPAGMTISSGVITWTPTAAGSEAVIVTATDTKDATTQPYTIVVSAVPVPPVAPVITAIPDQEVAWDAAPWNYTVVVAPGTGTITDWGLWGQPATMGIAYATATTALITWTNIAPAPAVYEIIVWVEASDGEFDEETFIIEVIAPVVPVLTATIWYNPTHSYVNAYTYVRGWAATADAVPVEVTVSEALATGEYLQIRWNDGTTDGGWEALTLKTGSTLVYAGTVTFDGAALSPLCKLVCVEVAKFDVDICPACLPTIILQDTVKVDSVDPYLDLKITFKDCDVCDPGAYFTFAPDTYDTCPILDCCGDACSGIDSWTIEDATTCPECATLTGTNCVAGTYLCGCLLYADGYNDHTGATEADETITYKLKFTFADNVGNAIVDTWAITVDTDSVVTFANNQGTPAESNTTAVFTVGTGIADIAYTTCTP